MVMDKPSYVTEKGLADLKEKLAHLLEVKRPEVIEQMQNVKADGEWMDNTEFQLFEDELALIDGRIRELQLMLDNAQLIGPESEENIVNIGDTVVLRTEDGELERYTIVGVAEADPSAGFISNESPLAQALLNHNVGEDVVVKAPAGDLLFHIVAVT